MLLPVVESKQVCHKLPDSMGQTAEAAYVFFLCVDEQPTLITDTKALLLWREGDDDFLEARITA